MESKTDGTTKPEAFQYSSYNIHNPNSMSQSINKTHTVKNQTHHENSYDTAEINGYLEIDNDMFGTQIDQETHYDAGSGEDMPYETNNISNPINYRNEYETDGYYSTGDYTMKTSNKYEGAQHLCAKLRESLDDAEYYYIQKNGDNNFTRQTDMFHDKPNLETYDQYEMSESEAMLKNDYDHKMYDTYEQTGERARTNYSSRTNFSGSSLSPCNVNDFKNKNSIYKEVLKKINETVSDLKDAGLEENTSPFHESVQNLNYIKRNQPNRLGTTDASHRRYNQQPRNHTSINSKQDRKAYSELDYSAKYGRQNLEQKFDAQSEPRIYSGARANSYE